MTEAEWLACDDPEMMLEFLRGKASDRKLRLFAVACCRSIWNRIHAVDKRAIEVIERYQDGLATDEELRIAEDDFGRSSSREVRAQSNPHWTVYWALDGTAIFAARGVVRRAQRVRLPTLEVAVQTLRDLFAPPSTSAIIHAEWCNLNSTTLAQAIHTDRAFDRLPILADALEDAGCDNRDILDHCRGPGPHVRGCWVVDQVLGKS